MISQALFVYGYDPTNNRYIDDDLLFHRLDNIQQNGGAQAAYTVTVDITNNHDLEKIDRELQKLFNQTLKDCEPMQYQDRVFEWDGYPHKVVKVNIPDYIYSSIIYTVQSLVTGNQYDLNHEEFLSVLYIDANPGMPHYETEE